MNSHDFMIAASIPLMAISIIYLLFPFDSPIEVIFGKSLDRLSTLDTYILMGISLIAAIVLCFKFAILISSNNAYNNIFLTVSMIAIYTGLICSTYSSINNSDISKTDFVSIIITKVLLIIDIIFYIFILKG